MLTAISWLPHAPLKALRRDVGRVHLQGIPFLASARGEGGCTVLVATEWGPEIWYAL